MNLTPCSCGAQVPNDGGVDHPVLAAAAPCWWRFRQLEARAEREARTHLKLLRDAYSAQHADGLANNDAHRDAVWFALVGLGSRTDSAHLDVAAPNIDPPRDMGALTVFDIPLDGSTDAFVTAIDAWAESVRNAWLAVPGFPDVLVPLASPFD